MKHRSVPLSHHAPPLSRTFRRSSAHTLILWGGGNPTEHVAPALKNPILMQRRRHCEPTALNPIRGPLWFWRLSVPRRPASRGSCEAHGTESPWISAAAMPRVSTASFAGCPVLHDSKVNIQPDARRLGGRLAADGGPRSTGARGRDSPLSAGSETRRRVSDRPLC
jgi:hypothetical protein